jgi:NAD(P)H-dependent FMN reductase
MPVLQVITASVRRERKGPLVADWFLGHARGHPGFSVEALDLADVDLPLFDEPSHPRLGRYEHEHTKAWSRTVDRADAFVFVTPEYDYGPPASLSNALQYLVREWAYKPAGFVSYGGVSGGTRGVQVTKLTLSALRVVPMVEAVAIPFFTQYVDKETGTFDPGEVQVRAAKAMLDELLRWTVALAQLRPPQPGSG